MSDNQNAKLSENEIIVGVKYATDINGVVVWLKFVIAELPEGFQLESEESGEKLND